MRIRLNAKDDQVEVLFGGTGAVDEAYTRDAARSFEFIADPVGQHQVAVVVDLAGFIRQVNLSGLAKIFAEFMPPKDADKKGKKP